MGSNSFFTSETDGQNPAGRRPIFPSVSTIFSYCPNVSLIVPPIYNSYKYPPSLAYNCNMGENRKHAQDITNCFCRGTPSFVSGVIRHFIYPQNQSTPVKINKVPASKKMTFIPSNSLILGPFCVILNSVPLKKTGSLLWRAPILSLINTFRAMPVHVSQDYDNGSL